MRSRPDRAAGPGPSGRWLLAAVLLLATLPTRAISGAGEPEAAERLVRTPRYEGLPASEIASLSPHAVARLATMLGDPGEVPHHARILEVLGRRGGRDAARAVLGFLAREPSGEIAPALYRARLAAWFAAGRLARDDPAALAYVLVHATPEEPPWACGHLRGEHLRALLGDAMLTALALSGRPEAEARLRGFRPPGTGRAAAGWERRLREALALHAEVAARRGRTPR